MIKDPEKNKSNEIYLDFLENMEPQGPYSMHAVIDPNDNHLVDTESHSVYDSEIEETGGVLYACDNISKNSFIKNATVCSKKDIVGIKTIDEDIRFSKSIFNYNKIIANKKYNNLDDYMSLIYNFNKRASNDAELLIFSSDNDIFIRKIAQESGLVIGNRGQFISIKRAESKFKFYNISGISFKCSVCDSDKDKALGLQAVDFLDKNEGMAFPYDSEKILSFAMKSVSFPIDMIFVSNFVVQKIFQNVQPGDQRIFSCIGDLVIELNGGTCKEYGISVGDSCIPSEYDTAENIDNVKRSSYCAYYLTDLVSVNNSIVKISGYDNFIFGKDSFGDRVNYSSSNKSFFGKKNSYFEPINNNFILINDSGLSNENAKRMFSSAFPEYSYSIIKISSRNPDFVGRAIESSFHCDELNLFDFSMSKSAAFPVPNSIREKALLIDKEIVKNIKRLKNINSNVQKNVSVYEVNKDNYSAIKGSSGVYRQSMKRLVASFKSMIFSIRVIIKSLNSIKDTVSIEEINASILSTTQNLSKFFKLILDMQEKTESLSFFSDLSKRTEDFLKISEDLETVQKRARDFIWTHVLGTPLLTD